MVKELKKQNKPSKPPSNLILVVDASRYLAFSPHMTIAPSYSMGVKHTRAKTQDNIKTPA